MKLRKKLFYYRIYYKGVFCRSLLAALLSGVLLLSLPFVDLVYSLSYIFLFGGLLCDFVYRYLFCMNDFYFYRNGSCSVIELCIVSFICSLIFVLIFSKVVVCLWECI